VEYVSDYTHATVDPAGWARAREDQGWSILSVADHFHFFARSYPHVWVSASAMAAATTQARITTAFTNNVFRSPVEVAQAALMMQLVADGRFELGMGAGWFRDEVIDAGMSYPEPRDRAGAFIESVQVVRSLLHTGRCDFKGTYYEVHIDGIGPVSERPPALIASVGGRRTIREVTPHCDKVEIKPFGSLSRSGEFDLYGWAQIPESHIVAMIEGVRRVRPDIEIGAYLICNVGDDDLTRELGRLAGDGIFSRFFGSASKVAEGMAWLGELGITRCQLGAIDDASYDRLAPVLFS
jgi:hypothetical protein